MNGGINDYSNTKLNISRLLGGFLAHQTTMGVFYGLIAHISGFTLYNNSPKGRKLNQIKAITPLSMLEDKNVL